MAFETRLKNEGMTEGPHGTQFGRYDAYKPLGNPPLERRYYWDVAKPMWHFKLGDVGIFALNHPHREGAQSQGSS